MKIAVIGSGYVGLANAVLLAKSHEVIMVDIDPSKVSKINDRISPIDDQLIITSLLNENLNLSASTSLKDSLLCADIVIVATPTNYDTKTNSFDTSSVESVISCSLSANNSSIIVIKSTIPVGFTSSICSRLNTDRILFSPEFLREGNALHDNLYPSRIIVGDKSKKGRIIADIFRGACKKENVDVLLTSSTEAEAIKLFSNTYLAMRVSFFNELDSYSEVHQLCSKSIIEGVCLDPRIGEGYNNPSFGYGGYCLPKDTKQLLANYENVPNNLIKAIVDANRTRKDFIVEMILEHSPKVVGIYLLVMKAGSDNYRSSAVQGIIKRLKGEGVKVIIFEPACLEKSFFNTELVNDLSEFKSRADLIVANRISQEIEDSIDKVYTRDLFRSDS